MALLFTISFLFLVMETLIGMVANGSIVLINFIDWFRIGKLSPTDLILISLGLSRLFLQVVVILNVIIVILFSDTMSDNTLVTLVCMWMYLTSLNLWFAACLSVFYLAKIAIFSHPVFLQVKQQFSGLVPWLLLGSVVFLAVQTTTVLTSWNYGFLTCNPYNSLLSNGSNVQMGITPMCRKISVLNSVFDFIPFMVFLSSSILLISSLWKHMRHVQCNGTGTRDLNTQAHLSAIKALASFAVLYLVSFVAAGFETTLVWRHQRTLTTVLFNVSALYPSGHAIILILINPKLKKAWFRIVNNLKCHWSKVPS